MSEIEHPSQDPDEHVSLVPSTIGFAVSSVVALVGMVLIILWNIEGGF